MKSKLFLLILLCCLLTGCTSLLPDQLTSAPIESQGELHSPVADENATQTYQAELYYRFLDEPWLTSESRLLTVRKDDSLERVLTEAVLAGPSAASPELRRLFGDDVTVEGTLAQGKLLFVTLSHNVLNAYGDEPANWAADAYWQAEVPLRRQLAMQSLAATLIENCGYDAVQILLHGQSDSNGSMRLPQSYYRTDEPGLAAPLYWDSSLLLTPDQAAQTLLTCYQQKDWERLYRYVALGGEEARPGEAAALTQMDAGLTLRSFALASPMISHSGLEAVVDCELTLADAFGTLQSVPHYPLRLIRENGIWKISWQELTRLLNRW